MSAKLLTPDFEVFERWAKEAKQDWSTFLDVADVTDPRDGSRGSRNRLKDGQAPRVRKRLYDALCKIERELPEPTMTGQLLMGLADWAELGAKLAELAPEKFLAMLAMLRSQVDAAVILRDAKAKSEDGMAAFGDMSPAVKPPKR